MNWLKDTIERGVKSEFLNAINIITNEFNIKLTMVQGIFGNDMAKMRKTFETGGNRIIEMVNSVFLMLNNKLDEKLNYDYFEKFMKESFDNFGNFIFRGLEGFILYGNNLIKGALLVIDENIKIISNEGNENAIKMLGYMSEMNANMNNGFTRIDERFQEFGQFDKSVVDFNDKHHQIMINNQ
jgi:hypothetical protein